MTVVKTPVKNWSGTFAGDVFVNGICENPSDSNMRYYSRHGYKISDLAPEPGEPDPEDQDSAPEKLKRPGSDAVKADWVAYAESLGINCDDLTIPEIINSVNEREAITTD